MSASWMRRARKAQQAKAREEAAYQKCFEHAKVMADDPEGSKGFVIVPTRYYLGMWFIELPEPLCRYGAKAGDVTMLVFRKLDEPTTWCLKYRHRYYLGPDPGNPYSGDDRRSWYWGTITDITEEELDRKMPEMIEGLRKGGAEISGIVLEPADFLPLRCTGDKAGEIMRNANKHWLHSRSHEQLKEDKFFSKIEEKQRLENIATDLEKQHPGRG